MRRRPSGKFSAPRLAAATEHILKGSSKERSPDMSVSDQRTKEQDIAIAGHNTHAAKVNMLMSFEEPLYSPRDSILGDLRSFVRIT